MFEKTLTDVVKGIRASKRDTSKYISQCISEIKSELNSSDMFVKANALQKLTFLQMMGFTMNWDRASFATIEVMSSPRFAHKRVGYLAAVRDRVTLYFDIYIYIDIDIYIIINIGTSMHNRTLFDATNILVCLFHILILIQSQGFTQDTEVVLLTTNLLKKELRGAIGGGMHGVYEAGLAINCISNIVTEDLARDLLPELNSLTSHPQPYLRKKAILCLFKLFVKYPQGLRLTFTRLQQCLEDPNSSVVSCAVNVITELSDKNPKNYLHLAPAFFQLLTQSSNNWMLIKVVKLLGSLVPEEPRLARKLLDPLAKIVQTTQAKSLLYESVRTITLCLPYCRKSDGTMPPNVPDIVELCATTLIDFVKQADQNLKYLGLVGFSTLMQSHPHVLNVPEYRPLILHCLTDPDVTIRTRALDLLTGMASKKNLIELITQLLNHVELAIGSYKNDLVVKIIEMCSGDKYTRLIDFKWYLDVLFQLGHYRGIEEHGELLMGQVTNVALRVAPVRPYAVRRSIELLLEGDGKTSDNIFGNNGRGKHLMIQFLPSIAWIIGEYSDQIQNALLIDPDETDGAQFSYNTDSKGTYHAIVQCLSTPVNLEKLPTSTQKVYLQAAMKTFAAASKSKSIQTTELEACVGTILMNFSFYTQSIDVEVAERSFTLLELMKALRLTPTDMSGGTENSHSVVNENAIDLLKIEGGAPADPITINTMTNGIDAHKVLESRIKLVSDTLVYLLKPTPMKPAPPKAQKKKREAPIGITIDIEAPIDLSLFHDLIIEDAKSRTDGRISVKAVSFTQQTPYRVVEPVVETAKSTGKSVVSATGPNVSNPLITGSVPPSTASSKQKKGDPFYLDSVPSTDSLDETDGPRFETIQLPDSSEEGSRDKVRLKHSKKPKKRKPVINNLSDWPSADQAVYDSEEDEGEDAKPSRRKGSNREFAGLAKVDLTTPLRDDEVMPQRTHRVVPERKPKAEKKTKKTKKKSTKVHEPPAEVGDLLDLGGTYSEFVPTRAAHVLISDNPINSAFDDLLSMPVAPLPDIHVESFFAHNAPTRTESYPANNASSTPSIAPQYSLTSFNAPLASHRPKRPWLKATLKASNASGDTVDWSSVSVLYQVIRLSDEINVRGQVRIQVDNRSGSALNGVTLDLKDYGVIPFHNISAMTFSSQSDKIGPISFDAPDSPKELKAVLRVGTSAIPVKIYLPVTLLLDPLSNLSLDRVAQELSTSDWSSATAKIEMLTIKDPIGVKECLRSFLRADLVEGSELSPETATYAAYSMSGTQVRFLVKVKNKSVKVDIKSNSNVFSKALAADLKRLII